MRGHLREVEPGVYDLLVNVKDTRTGKWKQKSRRFRGGKRKAQEALAAFVTEVAGGGYIEPSRDTLGAYLEQWLLGRKGTVSVHTWETYRDWICKHIGRTLGNVPLQKLTPAQIRVAYAELQESGRLDGKGGLSAKSVRQIHFILRSALEQAVIDDLLPSNPANRVKPPKCETHEMQVLDEEQTALLLEKAKEVSLFVPIVIAATTGMRLGEILGLRWQDIDFESATLTVVQALEDTKAGRRFKSPKTERSRRTIKLPPATIIVLKQWRREQMARRQAMGEQYQDHGLVVCRQDGKPLDPAGVSARWIRFIDASGLPKIRFHDLRHTHASQLLDQGAQLTEVSKRLGHSLPSTTLNIYAHRMKGAEDRMMERYAEGLKWKQAEGE